MIGGMEDHINIYEAMGCYAKKYPLSKTLYVCGINYSCLHWFNADGIQIMTTVINFWDLTR